MNGIVERARRALSNGTVSAAVAIMPELILEADALQRKNSRLNAEVEELRSQVRVLTQGGAA